jgi:type IV pilus assembly protein PilZ
MADPNDDRRDDGRAPITLRVDYKRLNTFFADYTRNISRGGTFIRTDKPLAVGTEFVFVLALPRTDAPELESAEIKLELKGIVKWVVLAAEATGEKPAGMGIQFLFAGDGERQRVEALVAELMGEALGARLASKLLGSGT